MYEYIQVCIEFQGTMTVELKKLGKIFFTLLKRIVFLIFWHFWQYLQQNNRLNHQRFLWKSQSM